MHTYIIIIKRAQRVDGVKSTRYGLCEEETTYIIVMKM